MAGITKLIMSLYMVTLISINIFLCKSDCSLTVSGNERETIELTLETGFEAWGNGFEEPKADKVGDLVTLRGTVKAPNAGTITTLPSGWRPAYRRIFTGSQSSQTDNRFNVRIDVYPDGSVTAENDPNIAWVSLDGISFYVD